MDSANSTQAERRTNSTIGTQHADGEDNGEDGVYGISVIALTEAHGVEPFSVENDVGLQDLKMTDDTQAEGHTDSEPSSVDMVSAQREDNGEDIYGAVWVEPSSVENGGVDSQDLGKTDSIHDSSIRQVKDLSPTDFCYCTSESTPVSSISLSPAPSPAMSTSIPLTGFSIDWYDDENGTSDEDLLEQFFQENPKLAMQVLRMKTQKGKRQTDAQLVRYYQFGLEIYGFLMERNWGNGHHMGSNPILKHLGLSAPWLTKARRVMELLAKIGPDSPNPNPIVIKRLSSGKSSGKGRDLLDFLQAPHLDLQSSDFL